jgi:hypothetical protein
MSTYGVNKFMRLVNMDAVALAAYRADPRAFTADFVADSVPGGWLKIARGAPLTDEEHEALAERSYGDLYRLGAHPYLLWSFAEAVWVPEIDRAKLVQRFRESAAAIGYPDFATTRDPQSQDANRRND